MIEQPQDVPAAQRNSAYIGKALYLAVSAILLLSALCVMGASVWNAAQAVWAGESAVSALLDTIALTVLALAVLDVSKYLLDEEVIRSRELRATSEARAALTKFLTIIIIAVSLEAVVLIFDASKQGRPDAVLYPSLLLISTVLIVLSLGLYQWLSARTERLTHERPKKPGQARRAAPATKRQASKTGNRGRS
jgi:hypothetical protein